MKIVMFAGLVVMVEFAACTVCGQDVQFAVDVQRVASHDGDVSLVVAFTNSTSGNIAVPNKAALVANCVTVVDSKGRKVGLTSLGKEALVAVSMSPGRGEIIGARKEHRISLELNRLFDMSLPDDYRVDVSVSYSVVTNGHPKTIGLNPRTAVVPHKGK